MSLLIILLPLLASTDTKPFLATLEVFTIGAGGVNCTLCVAFVALAGILHHGYKRRSIIRVNRILRKVGVDHNRFA